MSPDHLSDPQQISLSTGLSVPLIATPPHNPVKERSARKGQPSSVGQRFLLTAVSWSFYKLLRNELGDRHIFVTYDGRDLELMTPSLRHDRLGRVFGGLLEVVAEELDMAICCAGCMTHRRDDVQKALEPDDCFYIQNFPAIRGKEDVDLNVDPPPDLAIEVDLRRSLLDRMDIYASLGTPEVWRYDGERLRVYVLTAERTYNESPISPTFPHLCLDKMVEFAERYFETDDATLKRQFRAWVRADVVPRARGAGGSPPKA